MSKERLDEVIFNSMDVYAPETGKVESKDVSPEDFKWLIEQVEMLHNRFSYREYVSKLEHQVKRYREAVGHMKRIILHPFSKTLNKKETLHRIETILKALEGESDERKR